MKPADVAWPLRERNSLEISTRVEGTKRVQVGFDGDAALTAASDRDDVLAELSGIGTGHDDILPASASRR